MAAIFDSETCNIAWGTLSLSPNITNHINIEWYYRLLYKDEMCAISYQNNKKY